MIVRNTISETFVLQSVRITMCRVHARLVEYLGGMSAHMNALLSEIEWLGSVYGIIIPVNLGRKLPRLCVINCQTDSH